MSERDGWAHLWLCNAAGGAVKNLVLKYPGWRAREGFGQEKLGVPGEPDDPLAR